MSIPQSSLWALGYFFSHFKLNDLKIDSLKRLTVLKLANWLGAWFCS